MYGKKGGEITADLGEGGFEEEGFGNAWLVLPGRLGEGWGLSLVREECVFCCVQHSENSGFLKQAVCLVHQHR